VVTNADEAAGRRHQPAFLFLPARDMKEGGGSRWRFVPSVAEEVWKMGKLPYRLAENRSEGSSVIATMNRDELKIGCPDYVAQFKHIYRSQDKIS
jgi:hypothetical protein